MVQLAKTQREKKQLQLARLIAFRKKGGLSEDQIAERLGYKSEYGKSPAQRLYAELETLGLPDWLIYPDSVSGYKAKSAPYGVQTRAATSKTAAEKTVRKARATGDETQLPPATRAEALFRKDLERLANRIDKLPRRWEILQGERFASALLPEDEAFDLEVFDRSTFYRYPVGSEPEFLDKAWKEVCQKYGVDPTVDEFVARVTPTPYPLGASHTPRAGLTELIAVHILLNRSLDPLLDALHPNPQSVDRKKITEYADLIRVNAERVAIVVRGGRVRRGHHPGTISGLEMWEAWHLVEPLHQEGLSDQQILEELRAHGFFDEEPYEPGEKGDRHALEEIRRIIHLKLEPPKS